MTSMSDRKQIMVRLEPEDYEKLRWTAYVARIPVAVLARNLITQQLGRYEYPDDLSEADQDETPAENSPSSTPGRRSPNAKRRKKKKRGR